jgi:Fe2+ transport system protein FeoA
MTTFWLSFEDPEALSDKTFLGVAIFDMDESKRKLSVLEIVQRAWELGINPGGQVSVVEIGPIPDEHKNKLITDHELLLRLGSRGRTKKHLN